MVLPCSEHVYAQLTSEMATQMHTVTHLTVPQLNGTVKITGLRTINKIGKSAFKDDLETELQSIQSKTSNIDELIDKYNKP